jgi:hypothetical protein
MASGGDRTAATGPHIGWITISTLTSTFPLASWMMKGRIARHACGWDR